jgi:acyl dehydratase|tara:strand:- start:921 stop:1220 length:300 start_codon:yes stop_codon:yes gene_type:complete
VVATLAVDNWWVHLPVKHDDTNHMVRKMTFKREASKPDMDMGMVEFDSQIRNQRDEAAQSAKATNMCPRRPSRLLNYPEKCANPPCKGRQMRLCSADLA